jgi:Predicted periplasmic lipoprotein (DUF2279)
MVRAWLALAASLLGAPVVRASGFHLYTETAPSFVLGSEVLDQRPPIPIIEVPPPLELASLQDVPQPFPAPPTEELRKKRTKRLQAGFLLLAGVYSLSAPLNHEFVSFRTHQEHFFGKNTYAGGSDKVSHFIIAYGVSRELALAFDHLGNSKEYSNGWAFGLTAFGGIMVEIGNGFSAYGFSWEDLIMDWLGDAAGLILLRQGLDDLIGMRVGRVGTGIDPSPPPGHVEGLGLASNEIFSLDLKIAGLGKRLKFDPVVARFLLTSVTYSTKGYGFVPPLATRQRLVGFEIGLNLPEILSAVGVPDTTWWGSILYKLLNFIRIPYTSFGWRYDLNNGTWHGPDTGNVYYYPVF